MKVVCIRHPKYDGTNGKPVLGCKTCCNLFVLMLPKLEQENLNKIRDSL